jgi:hypothetical protein
LEKVTTLSSIVKDKPNRTQFGSESSSLCNARQLPLLRFFVLTLSFDSYWIWAYWINLFARLLRSLNVNEFQSKKWDTIEGDGNTQGENILSLFGLTLAKGEPFTFPWVWQVRYILELHCSCSIFTRSLWQWQAYRWDALFVIAAGHI